MVTMTRFKSSLSWHIVVPTGFILFLITPIMIVNEIWFGVVVNLLVSLFVFHMFYTTEYIITNGVLNVKSGFFFRRSIIIDKIASIKETNNATSSPAFSLDRLEIQYEWNKKILISPQHKEKFIQQITSINKKIDVIA